MSEGLLSLDPVGPDAAFPGLVARPGHRRGCRPDVIDDDAGIIGEARLDAADPRRGRALALAAAMSAGPAEAVPDEVAGCRFGVDRLDLRVHSTGAEGGIP